MHRRGGKRIRMDDELPPEYEAMIEDHHLGYPQDESGDSDHGDGATPTKGGRMTRLRARGGVRDKPPIIDDDVDEFVLPVMKKQKKQPRQLKIKPIVEPKERQERAPRERVERAPRERIERAHHAHHAAGEGGTGGGGLDDKERDVTTDETSLYYILRHSKASITSIVDDWITSYKVDRGQALIALMQFFINASGCKGKIEPQPPNAIEHTAIIRKMTEEFDEESGEYPLIMPGIVWKKFKTNFCDFVQTLVKQCQYSIIYDQFLMDHVISLLTGLSDSQVRAFRHTATLAAMKLMTSLVDVALLVSVNFDNAARQYEAERLKTRDKRANDRLESLMAKRTELEENMDEIKNMLTYMFKSVFVHRYRDTLPDIRAICMAEIGVWMQKFSQNFLDDSYLKYIGWTLHDKVGEVRLRCLQALLPLYASDELKGKLELFTSKFKDRIVAMTLDKEFDVAVHAVKLVISILKIHPDILADKDCEIVYELVYSSHRGVAQAAAEFLNVRLFRLDEDSNIPVKTRRGKVRLPNTPLLRDLVQFFIESELHEHGAYLVDSFIDSNAMVKDWECMTDLLLEEPGPTEEPMDNKQESTLIEVMVSSVRQSATGEPPVGRGSNRQKTLSAKEIKQVQDDKQRLTEHFIQTVPALLHRYSADAEKLNNLLAIPQYFELDIYTTSRQEASLQQLLDKIAHIMAIHTDREVLETCSKTLEFLCTENSAIYTRCDVARSNIIDQCVNKYKEAIDDWRNLIEGEEIPDEDEIYNVVISLKKVSILYSCHNLNQWNLFDSLFKDIEDLQTGALTPEKSLPEEALVYCIDSCTFATNWALYYIENQCESFGVPAAVDELRVKLHRFLVACTELIRRGASIAIQEAAYTSICDSLIVFSDQMSANTNNPHLKPLEYEASPQQVAVLNDFVQRHVFAIEQEDGHDERRIEELHKKRNSLAGFCKLIVYNIIPTKAAADIFKHYLRCYNEYGDIIKSTLGKAREINKVNCAMTMCLSLVTAYKDIQVRYNTHRVSKTCQEFADVKELAKRFALSFGLDATKSREAITALHRAGILFAVTQPPELMAEDPMAAPPCLLFLEIMMELTNKLIKQDKRPVLNFLDRRITATGRGEDWQPLFNYRNALLGESELGPVTPAPPKRAYRRRKEHSGGGGGEDDDDDDDGDNDPDYRG